MKVDAKIDASGEAFVDQAKICKSGNRLAPDVLRGLTRLNDGKATISVLVNISQAVLGVTPALIEQNIWTVLWAMLVVPLAAHGFAILSHDAVHYRLFSGRRLNDFVGRGCGLIIGVSMCTYRVVHRLHHNHLYERGLDPDIALMAGYPRGKTYLFRKLAIDLTGVTAWKNYSYFMGRPAKNSETNQRVKPLDDTSPKLRDDAKQDRILVAVFHLTILVLAIGTGLWREYLLLWFIPLVTIFQVILRLRAVLEHGAVTDFSSPLTASRTNLIPASIGWLLFPHKVNYHVEHHLYPSVPHYNLPACHKACQEAGMLDWAEVVPVNVALGKIFADRPAKEAVA
jgi:fatty acid desaturase